MADHTPPSNLPSEPGATPEKEKIEQETKEESEKRSRSGNILAIVGLVLVAIIVVWGLIHLISLIGGWGANQEPNEAINISAPGAATSGQSFTVAWQYTPKQQGSYAFVYPCTKNLTFSAVTDGANIAIPCGAAFTMPPTSTSLTVTPKLSVASSTVTTISIVYLPSATSSTALAGEAQGSTTITINPEAKTSSTGTKKPTTSTNKQTNSRAVSHPVYTSPANITVSGITGSVDSSGNGVVTFTVANTGGSPSGSYRFTATFPSPTSPYSSVVQKALGPGDRVVNTLRFGPVNPGGGAFSVTVIPSGADSNSSDNTASYTLACPCSGQYNYQNGYPLPSYTSYGGSVYGTPYGPQYQYYQN